MTEVFMTTKERHSAQKKSAQKKRRQRAVRRRWTAIIAIAVGVVLLLCLYTNTVRNRTLDTTEAYSIGNEDTATDFSNFALQSLSAEGDDLVASDSEYGDDLISLSSDTEHALLFNIDDSEPIYAHGIYDKVYPASLTKIMTAIVCFENSSMDVTVTMQEEDFELDEEAQESELDVGDTLTMEDLMKLLLVYSANEAAMAIARTVGGSVDAFVEMMNEKAQELGMTGTNFVNPTGLHDDNHYTTPYDIYLMLNAAYEIPEFSQYSSVDSIEVSVTGTEGDSTFTEESTDEFLTGIYSLPQNVTIMASKTGTTDEAGSCLSLIVQNDYGVNYCAVITGALDKDSLYGDMINLLSLVNTSDSDNTDSESVSSTS
jgi:D-alanyl-D-alanine carboxypeptidase